MEELQKERLKLEEEEEASTERRPSGRFPEDLMSRMNTTFEMGWASN